MHRHPRSLCGFALFGLHGLALLAVGPGAGVVGGGVAHRYWDIAQHGLQGVLGEGTGLDANVLYLTRRRKIDLQRSARRAFALCGALSVRSAHRAPSEAKAGVSAALA